MKILIIQLKQVGDVVIASLLANNVRTMYPNAEIHFFVYASTAPVLWHNPSIDQLILLEERHRQSKMAFLQLIWRIRKQHYDVIIDAYSKIESWLTVFFSKAPKKISYLKKMRQFLYTDHIARTDSSDMAGAIHHKLALLAPLKNRQSLDPVTKIHLQTDEQRAGLAQLSAYTPLTNHGKKLMLNILGSIDSKTYPPAYMAQLLDHIVQHGQYHIVLNYHPAQKSQAQHLLSYCKAETRAKIDRQTAADSLRGFIQLMSVCDAIIGNEGGAIHIAKALDKASFTLFSPAISKEQWATYADKPKHVALHLRDFEPDLFAGFSAKSLRAQNRLLYNAFTPKYIVPLLERFLASL